MIGYFMVPHSLRWITLETVDSTNSWLMQSLKAGAVEGPTALFAKNQLAGRGRRGREWLSVPDSSLTVSVAMPVHADLMRVVSLRVGLTVVDYYNKLGLALQLKWPNDLLSQNRKLGGILCESIFLSGVPWVVIGIGINLMSLSITTDGANLSPISLQEVGLNCDQRNAESIANELIEAVYADLTHCPSLEDDELRRRFASVDAWRGKDVCVSDDGKLLFCGRAAGLGENGEYLVDSADGLKAIMVGDLSLRLSHG